MPHALQVLYLSVFILQVVMPVVMHGKEGHPCSEADTKTVRSMVFNATFNNISVISLRSVLFTCIL